MTVALDDLVPGVVVHLDTDVLRAAGGSRTNAQARTTFSC
jgi:hypothetical protein